MPDLGQPASQGQIVTRVSRIRTAGPVLPALSGTFGMRIVGKIFGTHPADESGAVVVFHLGQLVGTALARHR